MTGSRTAVGFSGHDWPKLPRFCNNSPTMVTLIENEAHNDRGPQA